MINKVILIGNIGRAPQISLTQDGREIAKFSLATNISWKDDTGEWQTHTDWHRIIVFRKAMVGWIKDELKGGNTVYVEGKLTYHSKKDKLNNKHLTPYIVISGSEGKIEYIRSPKTESSSSDEKPKSQRETHLLENNPSDLEESPQTHIESAEENSPIQPIHLEKEKI